MEVIALVKGDKGLYYSTGEKMYFPDRSWKDAKEGFAELIDVTNDKGNYAFIKGRMLETVEPTKDAIAKYINIEDSFVGKVHLGDSVGFSIKTGDGIEVYIQTSDNVHLVHRDKNYTYMGRLMKEHYRKRLYTYDLVRNSEKYDITELYEDYLKEHNFPIESKNDFIESCVRIYSNPAFIGKVARVSLYGDLFYIAESSTGNSSVYVRDVVGVKPFHKVSVEEVIKRYSQKYTMSGKEITDFMLNNHICGTYGFSAYDELCEKTLSALGVSVKLFAYNGEVFSFSMFENKTIKELVDNSFEELQAVTKRIGKQCTGRLVSELQNLNPRTWLID